MNTTHIVIGASVGKYFQQFINQYEAFQGKLLVIEDDFSVGPLKDEQLAFSALRSQFWNTLELQAKNHILNDLEAVVEVSTRLTNDEILSVCIWISPSAQDLSTYFFLLFFLKKHVGKLHIININGLPFLDNELKLFFPTSFLDINTKGILKATKLARLITYTEVELAHDEWLRIRNASCNLRVVNSLNKLIALSDEEVRQLLLSKLVNAPLKHSALMKVLNPSSSPLKDLFFSYHLHHLLQDHKLVYEQNFYSILE